MIDKCPECGGEIQATSRTYLSGVWMDPDTGLWDYASSHTDSDDTFYCENDHDLTVWFFEQQREAFTRKARA